MIGKTLQVKSIAKILAFYGLVGLLGVCLAFYPTLLSGFSKLQSDPGDPRYVNYVLEHSFQVVFNRNYHASLWTPGFFFPFQETLALSENLLGSAPIYWFFRIFLVPDLAYQVWTIVNPFLCFLSCAIVLRSLKVNHVLSAFSGFIFGFGLVRIGRLFHSQLLPQFFTPIAFLLVWKFLQKPSANRLRLSLVFIFLQVLSSIYLGWFLLFGLLIFVPIVLLFDRTRLSALIEFVRSQWKSTIAAFSIWFAAMVLLLSPYLRMSKLLGARSFEEVKTMLPRLTSWIFPPPDTLWASSLAPLSKDTPLPHEHWIFMGVTVFVAVGFAVYSLLYQQKRLGEDRTLLVKACLTTALIIFALSLYVSPGFSLWQIIYTLVPGATSIRAVARIALLVQFLLLVAAVLCLDSALKRTSPRIAIVLSLLILAISIPENLIAQPLSYEKAPILKAEAELTELMKQGCEVAYVNLRSSESYYIQQLSAMWAGLKAGVPVVNGYSGSPPPMMPGQAAISLRFSEIIQWFESVKSSPEGRLCLIANTEDRLSANRQIESGISLESVGSNTQYFSRDRRHTAFVIALPLSLPPQAYNQAIRAADQPTTLSPGQRITLPVFVRNTSPLTWIQSTQHPINFSYRWITASGVKDAGTGDRTRLPIVVAPETAIALNAAIQAPRKPGQYILRLSLVHENVAWFTEKGAKPLDLPVNVIR